MSMSISKPGPRGKHVRNRLLAKQYDGCSSTYLTWRASRLRQQATHAQAEKEPHTHWLSPSLNTAADQAALATLCIAMQNHGYALYQWSSSPNNLQQSIKLLHHCLGLQQSDSGVVTGTDKLSLLEDLSGTPQGRFIPYTHRAMNWHTDGYYNDSARAVRCFTLHCIQPASHGGALTIMDNDLLLIALYDEDPQLVALLSHPEAMLLPANSDEQGHDRPDRVAPVFSMYPDGSLGTRFTARVQHIEWRSPDTKAAARKSLELINDHPHWHRSLRLTTDQGIITRNVLHRREAFEDAQHSTRRQMLRGRFMQLPTPAVSNQPA